jgi:hypothetical protein
MSKALQEALAAYGATDFREVFAACMDKGTTERPPKPEQRYRAFVVHPSKPGPQTLAIGHREGEKVVVDLLRDGLTITQAAELVKGYGIERVTGAANDEDDKALHAIVGVVSLLQEDAADERRP